MYNALFYMYIAAGSKITGKNIPRVSADSVLNGVLNAVYFIVGLVAVLMIIIAGIRYVTSAGDPSAVANAKNTILYAVVGLIVIMMAFVITGFIMGRF